MCCEVGVSETLTCFPLLAARAHNGLFRDTRADTRLPAPCALRTPLAYVLLNVHHYLLLCEQLATSESMSPHVLSLHT